MTVVMLICSSKMKNIDVKNNLFYTFCSVFRLLYYKQDFFSIHYIYSFYVTYDFHRKINNNTIYNIGIDLGS